MEKNMKKVKVVILGFTLVILTGAGVICNVRATTVYDVYDVDDIEPALDASSDGDTVLFHDGTYVLEESIWVSKAITLKAESYFVILDGTNIDQDYPIILFDNPGIGVIGFVFKNYNCAIGCSGYSGYICDNIIVGDGAGVGISAPFGVTIQHNRIQNNYFGIYFWNSRNNKIFYNTIQENYVGINAEAPDQPGPMSSINNLIFHNNFLSNNAHVSMHSSYNVNTWNKPLPQGGNYWSGYTVQGNPSLIPVSLGYGNYDYYPYETIDGWHIPKPPERLQDCILE